MFARSCLVVLTTLMCALGAAEGKIGVLNIESVINNTSMMVQVKDELDGRMSMVRNELETVRGELDKLKAELESVPKGSAAFMHTQEQFEITKLRREMYLKRSTALLEQQEILMLTEIYNVIQVTLKDFAAQEGYDIIFVARPQLQANNSQDFKLQLATQGISFHREDMDITEAFTAYLNQVSPTLKSLQKDEPAGSNEGSAPQLNLDGG